MQSYQPISLIELKDKYAIAKTYFENKQVPIDLVNEITDFLIYATEDPVERIYSSLELKKFLFEELLGGLSKRISLIRSLEAEFLDCIKRFVMTCCELFAKEVERDNGDMADAMRHIFEYTSNLNQNLFQQEETQNQAPIDQSILEKLSPEEREWRQSFQVGSKLDAIKVDLETNVKMWSKGEITEIEGDFIKVQFEHEFTYMSRKFPWYSPELDRYNSKSQGDEWRLDLKKDDHIDAFDSTKIWYGATIQETEIRNDQGRDIPYVKVGFRVFHPDGNKEDDEKRKFFGWSKSFDEWLSAYNPRIQKYQSFVKTLEDPEQKQASQVYEDTMDDQMDNLLYSNPDFPVYAVLRRKCRSGLLVDFLNKFGDLGGYDKILERINLENNDNLGLETVFYYVDCLAKSTPLFNKVFISSYLPKIEEAIRKKLLNASEALLRNVKKDRIDGIVQNLIGVLLTRTKTYKQREQDKNVFNLEIGCLFLEQNFLEKRIDGAKIIQDVCKSTNMMTYSSVHDMAVNNSSRVQEQQFVTQIIERLKEKKVLWQIFSKERSHIQLVNRSEELLKLLVSQDQLSEEELDFIWNSTKIDETAKLELYKVFHEISARLRSQQVSFIVEKISQIPLNKVVMEEIELIYELAKRSRNSESDYGQKAAEFLWNITLSGHDNMDKQIVNQAAIFFAEVIKSWDNSYKVQYVEKITENLKQGVEGFLSLKMLQKIIKDFQGTMIYVQTQENENQDQANQEQEAQEADKYSSRSSFIEFIVQEYNFFQIFFENFEAYMFKARTGLRKKIEQEPNVDQKTLHDKVLADRFIHSEQLNDRLEFIKYIASNSRVRITYNQLKMLWNELVVHQMFKLDSEMFYRWLKDACDGLFTGLNCVVQGDLIEFFKEEITSDGSAFFMGTSLAAFECFQHLFVLTNEAQRKLIRLGQTQFGSANQKPVQSFTSYSSATGQEYKSYSFTTNQALRNAARRENTDEDIEFHIIVSPSELERIKCIWQITVSSVDSKVTEKAIPFLIKLYTSVTYSLEKHIPDFEKQYLNICFESIEQLKNAIHNRPEKLKEEFERVEKPVLKNSSFTTSVLQRVIPPEERQILRYILLIKELVKNSERDGTLGVKSHNSLFKGEYLPNLQVCNQLKNGSKYMSKLEVGVWSNTTVWELRKIVGELVTRVYSNTEDQNSVYYQDTPCHPASIRIYRSMNCSDIKDTENGRTLAELKFKPNETLTAFRKNLLASTKVPLLNIDGNDMSDRAYAIFTEWFNRYSVEDPDIPGHRVMTPATCAAFTRSCTEDQCGEDDSRIIYLFETYDRDGDGKMQLDEFLNFYRACCFEKEDIVRQNLMQHYIRYDLKKQPLDGDPDEIVQVRRSFTDMPRYRVANDQHFFDSIFDLLDLHGDVSTSAWSLIKFMSTNPILYKKVLELNKGADFRWEQIFDSSNIYKMLYTLQIVEALLEEETQDHIDRDQTDEESILKHDWVERFLSQGGFHEILSLFHKSIELIGQKQVDTLTKFEKSFLEYMLKLIRIFILSAYTSGDNSMLDLLNLVKKKSSQIENQQEAKTEQDKEVGTEDTTQNQSENKFVTPAKQVKGKFVNNQDQKNLVNQFYQPEVTQDFLFGETLEEKPDPEKQEQDKQKDTQQEPLQTQSAQHERQENENERFSRMSAIMKQTGLGEVILQKIDFKDLQLQVVEVVCLMLGKKDIGNDDLQIMENALSLWVACLIKNDDLIDQFYTITRPESRAGIIGIKCAQDFILTGLYTYKSPRAREEFLNTLTCIAAKAKRNHGVKPLVYLLDILKRNFPREDQYYATRECVQFFDLFGNLIDEYILRCTTMEINQQAVNMFDVLTEAIKKLKKYETKEKKGNIIEDKTLIGYFKLIEKLIGYLGTVDKDHLFEVIESTGLMHELFYENLFFNPSYSLNKNENKAKTKESRAAGYSLLQKVVESLEPCYLADFFEQYLWPLIGDLQRPKKWKYVPAENTKTSQFVGIINLGCICYMISMLQQFYMVPQFRYQLLRAEDTSVEDIKEYKGRKVDDNLLKQLQKMFSFLELSEMQAYDPFDFCFAFKDFEGNPTNTALQQDSQEFLNIFFDRVEELLKPTKQKYLLDSVFGGKVCSQLICQSCGNVRNILENFYNLSLPVKDRKSLDQSLQKMIEGSIINDYRCEACNQKVDVFKRSLIAETPNVLIVHLQRIIFNFDTFQNDKINTRFEFPNILNLKEYSFKEVMKAEGRNLKDEEAIKHLYDMQDDEFIYKLVGVNIHIGTAEHGHYYSLINTKRGHDECDETKPEWMQTEKDYWREFNDEQIKLFTFSDLKTEAFGGSSGANHMADNEMSAYLVHSGTAQSYGKNAYMLIYERQKKKDLKVLERQTILYNPCSKEQVQMTPSSQALECIDTAESRADQNENEFIEKYIPYRKVEPYVPEHFKQLVLQDNSVFLRDRLIYHESFFNMVKAVYKHISNKVILTQHHYKLDYLHHFTRLKRMSLKVAHKLLFDLLSYYYYNTQMSDLTSSLQSIITFCDSSYSLSRGDDSIILEFLNRCYLDDNCEHFYKIMFDCGDKTSRYYIGRITSFVLNKAFQLYSETANKEAPRVVEIKEAAEGLLIRFIKTLKSPDCMRNWSRLEQFFRVIQDVGTGGHLQSEIILTHFDITVEIIDFMLGNKSPIAIERGEKRIHMGGQGHGNTPPFQPLVSFVCYITRYRMTPAMRLEEHLWDETNSPPKTLLGYDLQRDKERGERFPLTERAYQIVVHSPFLEQVLQEGIECEEVGKMLAHFCYKNLRLTKQISKLLLSGISRSDIDKVKSYLEMVTQVALIKDDLQIKRLEWMFGFGSLIGQTPTLSRDQEEDQVVTKVGVKVLSSAGDEVYQYRSSLICDSMIDSLLHLLWRYKGRLDTYTISCLYSLLNLISADDDIAHYFSKIPGPTYFQARYTDWIRPYLEDQLVDARKGYSGTYSAQKEEICVKALSLLEKYESIINGVSNQSTSTQAPQVIEMVQIKKKENVDDKGIEDDETVDDDQENIRNLIEIIADDGIKVRHQQPTEATQLNTNVIRIDPQPYIIADVVSEKIVMSQNFDGVIVNVTQIGCFYTESQPTGNFNLSLPTNLFRKKGHGFQRASQRTQETEMQANCINNYFQSSSFAKKRNFDGKISNIIVDNLEGQEGQNRVFQDDDRQWGKVRGEEGDDAGYQQDNEGVRNVQSLAQEEEAILDQHPPEEVSYRIKVVEEGNNYDNENVEVVGMVNYDDNYQDQHQQYDRDQEASNVKINEPEVTYHYHDEDEQQQQNEPEQEIIWPNQLNYSDDLVYRVTVINHLNNPVKISFLFQEADPTKPCNLFYPKGGMKAQIYSKQTRTVILLHKIIPDDNTGEIHNLVFETFVKEVGNNKGHGHSAHREGRNKEPGFNLAAIPLDEINEHDDQIGEELDNGDRINVSDSNINPDGDGYKNQLEFIANDLKECPACTYLNDPKNAFCEICTGNLS